MKRSLFVVLMLVGVVGAGGGCWMQKASAPALGSVAEFPDYPGAVQVEFKQGADVEKGFTRKTEAEWTSTAPYATVMAHYQKAITDGGWVVTETQSKATEVEWKLAKGTSIAKIEIKQKAVVTIKVERRDR